MHQQHIKALMPYSIIHTRKKHTHKSAWKASYGHTPWADWSFPLGIEASPGLWSTASELLLLNQCHTRCLSKGLLLRKRHIWLTGYCTLCVYSSCDVFACFKCSTHVALGLHNKCMNVPLSKASLIWLTSLWEPGTRNIPSWCRPENKRI